MQKGDENKTNLISVMGISMGDEGKGRVVHELLEQIERDSGKPAAGVMKVNGGANAGQTATRGTKIRRCKRKPAKRLALSRPWGERLVLWALETRGNRPARVQLLILILTVTRQRKLCKDLATPLV